MANLETAKKPEQPNIAEIFSGSYDYAVLMPYSQNLRDNGGQRLSFYSAFTTNTTAEAYRTGKTSKIILCGEATFGKDRKTTSDLQTEALIRLGVKPEDIIILEANNLNSTPFQIEAVAKFQRDNNFMDKSFLFIDFPFHDARIKNYIKGYAVKNAQTVSAVDMHKYFMPKFNQAKMEEVVPFNELFEKKEAGMGTIFARQLSTIDKKGRIHKVLTRINGTRITDNKRVIDRNGSHLEIENTTGKKRMREVMGAGKSS